MSRPVCETCWCPYDEFTGECACPPPVVRDDTALLRKALEALELAQDGCIHGEMAEPSPIFADAITALRERLGETK